MAAPMEEHEYLSFHTEVPKIVIPDIPAISQIIDQAGHVFILGQQHGSLENGKILTPVKISGFDMTAELPSASISRCIQGFTDGQQLVDRNENIVSGNGTYERNGILYSSLAGYTNIEQSSETAKTTISVLNSRSQNLVPVLGGLVTCRVTQATPRFCKVDIIAVADSIFEIPFKGLLRKEDVRATEKDKIEIHKCFRPADIVLCRVISIGDAQSYIVSTAENELGVIIATSEAGLSMVPISWREMQCPKTKSIEYRKVAKPTSDYMNELKGELELKSSKKK